MWPNPQIGREFSKSFELCAKCRDTKGFLSYPLPYCLNVNGMVSINVVLCNLLTLCLGVCICMYMHLYAYIILPSGAWQGEEIRNMLLLAAQRQVLYVYKIK